MNQKKWTIGQRLVAGFAIVILLGVSLGAFASFMMRQATNGAHFLAAAVAPQANVTTSMAESLSAARIAINEFSRTNDPAYEEAAESSLEKLREALAATRKLSDEQPTLTLLREEVPKAEAAFQRYRESYQRTRDNLAAISRIRSESDASVEVFLRNIEEYIQTQNLRLAEEIASALESKALEERRLRNQLANDILDLCNRIRVANYRTQATGEKNFIVAHQPDFAQITTKLDQLKAISRDPSNLQRIAEVRDSANRYEQTVEAIFAAIEEADTIARQRFENAETLDAIINNALRKSAERTMDYANESSVALGSSSWGVMVGLVLMIAVGIAAGFIITRTINKQLIQTTDTLSQGSLQVAAASSQVSASSQSLAQGSSQQAASLEEISSSIEELTSMTRRNADNSKAGTTAANGARRAAEDGAEEMDRMREAMDAIQGSSQEISKIIKTIDEIAFQTNILALNAAVEAARAGEAGAGFAVVAEEVRALAQRSAVAAQETADKIADATERSSQGVEISVRVAEGLKTIVEKTREVDKLVAEVADASREQSEGLDQINTAIGDMDRITQSSAANAEETASAAEELNAQSAELRNAAQGLANLVGAKIEKAAPERRSDSDLPRKPALVSSNGHHGFSNGGHGAHLPYRNGQKHSSPSRNETKGNMGSHPAVTADDEMDSFFTPHRR
jgi:hypothetical protein